MLQVHYYMTGSIYKVAEETMVRLAKSVFGEVHARSTTFGYKIEAKTPLGEFVLYNMLFDGDRWDFTGYFKGSQNDLDHFAKRMVEELLATAFNYSIGFVELDEDGEETGYEYSCDHPEYEQRPGI
jgi:hypothetical protein